MSKQRVLKKRSHGWEPTQRDLDTILNRLKHTGQESITHIEENIMRRSADSIVNYIPKIQLTALIINISLLLSISDTYSGNIG